MADSYFFSRHSAHLTGIADQGVVSITTFLTGLFIARYCLKEEYGLYYLALTQLPFWDNLRLALVSTAATVFLPRKKGMERRAYLGASLALETGLVFTGIVCALILALVFRILDLGLAPVFEASTALIAGHLLMRYLRGVFYARLKSHIALMIGVVAGFIQLGGILLIRSVIGLNAVSAVLVVAFAQLAGSAVGLAVLVRMREISFENIRLREISRENWKFGHWLVWKSLAYAASFNVFPWFLQFARGTAAVSTLAACVVIMGILNPLWLGLSNSLGARLAHAYAGKDGRRLWKACRDGQLLLFIVILFPAAIICLFAGPLLELFYQAKYAGNEWIVVGLCVAFLLNISTYVFELALLTGEKSKVVFFIYLWVLCICAAPGFLLFWMWGIAGYVMTCLCASIIRIYYFRRESDFWLQSTGGAK